jgi:NAD(P)-dependent dehydrogenase (short-subunit alcohol dehydrogenase family)
MFGACVPSALSTAWASWRKMKRVYKRFWVEQRNLWFLGGSMELPGKVALVTGGAIRVGKSIALALAGAGADILLNYHSSATAAMETAKEIESMGRQVLSFRADVSQAAQVEALIAAGIARFGRLDVLVNSASVWRRTPWADLDEAGWDQAFATDLKGAFLCAKTAAPYLALHADGAIVNITDLSALMPFPNMLAHSAAKAGLLNMTYALAMELAPSVRVNAIAPGPVLAPPDYDAKLLEATAQRTLLGRWGTPNDVAEAVVFLVRASFITGVVLPVDGGERLRGRGGRPAQDRPR